MNLTCTHTSLIVRDFLPLHLPIHFGDIPIFCMGNFQEKSPKRSSEKSPYLMKMAIANIDELDAIQKNRTLNCVPEVLKSSEKALTRV